MNGNNGKVLALIGAALIGVGVFLPIVSVPKRGTSSLMQGDYTGGLVMLGLAAAIVLLTLINRTRHVVWPGVASLALMAYAYIRVQTVIEQARQRLGETENPLAIVIDAAAANSRTEWGWAVLVLGAILAIAGGVLAWREPRVPAPPEP
jgi:uncharacterized membrane protein